MRSVLEFYTGARPGWPPLNTVTYAALLILCFVYAWRRGGTPEKAAAAIHLTGSILTLAALSEPQTRYASVEIGILVVDLVCMAAFVALALRADRFWPLWLAALQIGGTSVHALKFLDPGIAGKIYAYLLAIWSYPMIVLICAGTWRHQQRIVRFGFDRAWSR